MALRRTDQKEHIRRAAARLFAEKGYDGAGIQELSEAVGLGRGALYHHIGSKERLLYDIVAGHSLEVLEQARAILSGDTGAEDKLRRLSRITMVTIADNLPEWTVFFRDLGALSGPLRRDVIAARDGIEDVWVAVFRQGVEEGVFRDADPVVVKGLLGMHNYSHVWMRPNGRLTPTAIADLFMDVVLAGLRR
jgi:AcrR family transcriptional regulator